MKFRLMALALVPVAAVALSGCGNHAPGGSAADNKDPVVIAAKKEGGLTWYSADSPTANSAVAEAFERTYGIKVNVVRAISGDLIPRFLTEAKSGKVLADVIQTGDSPFHDECLDQKLVLKLNELQLPSVDSWPKEYRHDSGVVVSSNPFGIAYNTNLVKEGDAPKKWDDVLTKPNKVTLVDIRQATAYLAAAAVWQDKVGPGFMPGIAQSKPTLAKSTVPGAQSVAAGEGAYLLPTMRSYIVPLTKSGAPIKFAMPSETSGVEEVLSAVSNAPHPNAAKLFMRFMTSEEGQKAIVKADLLSPAKMGGSEPLPAGYVSPNLTEDLKAKDQYYKALGLQ